MHYYQHHIKDFDHATRHLSRIERSLYRDAIEFYYDIEHPLTANDFSALCKRLMAHTEEEKTALQYVLSEFFELIGGFYCHKRCDEEIERYRSSKTSKSIAGKASAASRQKKSRARKAKIEQKGTGVEQVLNSVPTEAQQNPTNHKPLTINHKRLKELAQSPSDSEPEALKSDDPVLGKLPTNRFNTLGEEFEVLTSLRDQLRETYPAINVDQELREIKAWLLTNAGRRKTLGGMPRFINTWLAREQDRGGKISGPNQINGQPAGQHRDTRKLSGAERTRIAREQAREREVSAG